MSEKLQERLRALKDEYLHFERAGATWENYRDEAIRKVIALLPIGSEGSFGVGLGKTLIRCEFEAIAAASEKDLRDLVRCGIYWDSLEQCLALDHLTGMVVTAMIERPE